MKSSELDKKLKEKLIQESAKGYKIITVYNSDPAQKNRRNTKRAKFLEKLIIEEGFAYEKISVAHSKWETEYDFIVFGTSLLTKKGIEDFIKEIEPKFRNFAIISEDIQKFLVDKEFDHPILKSEKQACNEKNQIILEDVFTIPEQINGWSVYRIFDENHYLYANSGMLCSIGLQPDGRWKNHYGTIRPVGASIKIEYFDSREEAFKNLKHPFNRKTC